MLIFFAFVFLYKNHYQSSMYVTFEFFIVTNFCIKNNKFRYKSCSLHLNDEEKMYIYFVHAMLENQILCFLVFNLHYQNKFL